MWQGNDKKWTWQTDFKENAEDNGENQSCNKQYKELEIQLALKGDQY